MPEMRKRLVLILVGSFLVILVLGGDRLNAQTTPDKRIGLTEVFWLPDEAVDLGVGWERILFYWREIQPEGPDDWNTLHVHEEWLDEASIRGREVVGLIKNTAPWASEDGTEAGLPKGLYLPIDDPDNLWANYIGRLTDYYSQHGVHHWIIWNEPEISQGTYGFEFAGTVTDYYQLLKTAYKVIKERDPDATVLLAGLTYWHDPTFLDRLLAIAAADPEAADNNYFFDAISLHIYFRTETVRTIVNEVNETQERYGLEKPVWINETNAPPNLDPEWPVNRPRFNIDLDQQAWFIIQSVALGFGSGAERVSVYKLLDIHLPPGGESFGLVRPDYSRRPAYNAYKLLTRCLGGFETVTMNMDPLTYQVTFEQPGMLTHVAWARTPAESPIQIKATADSATLVRLNEEPTEVKNENGYYSLSLPGQRCDVECLVGGEPLVLVEARGDTSRLESCVNFPEVVAIEEAVDQEAEIDGDLTGDEQIGQGATPSSAESVADQLGQLAVPAEETVTGAAETENSAVRMPTATVIQEEISDLPTATIDSGSNVASHPDARADEATQASVSQDSGAIGLWFLAAGLVLAVVVLFLKYRAGIVRKHD